jgi:plasmid recombination enzyme
MIMAANQKFSMQAVYNQLKHVSREIKYPKNIDIDKSRTHLNYSLHPNRNMTELEYLKKRLSEIHIHSDRQDINYMSGWVITKPKDLSDEYEEIFFKACYEFLIKRYGGEQNVVSADVHKDESGEPHLHFCFIPVTDYEPNENLVKIVNYFKKNPDANNTKAAAELGISRKTVRRYRNCTDKDIKFEKLSAKSVINKADLQSFHQDLQRYLDKHKIPAKVYTGITKAQGGNMTVEQLKMQRNYLLEHGGNVKEIVKTIDNIVNEIDNLIEM